MGRQETSALGVAMPDDAYPRATVCIVDGQVVLDDPDALAMLRAVSKHNCRGTLQLHSERCQHFIRRIVERGESIATSVIVILNVDAPGGEELADVLMP